MENFTFNYGIIATVPHPEDADKLSVVHFVGFVNEPDDLSYQNIYNELKTDPEFGLIDVDFDLHAAPQHVVDKFKADFEADLKNMDDDKE